MKYYYNNILLLTIFSFMSIGLGQSDDLTDLTLYRNLNQEGFNSAARDTGDVISSFASPTSYTMGIAWDGEYLWISGSSPEWIYKVTTLGTVIDSVPNSGNRGLAWDGEYLWAATTVYDKLYKINVETGEVVDSLYSPCGGSYPNGLTYDGELLWVSSFSEEDLCGVNTNTGVKVDSISLPNAYGRGVAWTGTNFWWADQDWSPSGEGFLYEIDVNGNVISTIDYSENVGYLLNPGLTFDGQYLWASGYSDGIIYQIDIGYESSSTNTYVPDDNFEQALIDLGYDDTLDNYVVTDIISGVTYLNVYNDSISDLTGIEAFTALDTLVCGFNQLTELDVSNNTALTQMSIGGNQLTSLDVSSNTALTYLDCHLNQITSLDLSSNTALTSLSCRHNALTELDVSSNTALTLLNGYGNQLTSLDLSNNTALTYLTCNNNQLTYLNMKNGVTDALTTFNATNNVSLECIETLDPDYATENWTYDNGNIDEGVFFSESCTALISVSPSELSEQLFEGDSSTQVLTISNGGAIDLEWNIGSFGRDGDVVLYEGIEYYLDGSGGICEDGYELAPQSILDSIASDFIGLTYYSTVSDNCCIVHRDQDEEGQDWGMGTNTSCDEGNDCNSADPWNCGPMLDGAGCTDAMNMNSNQLTLCMSSQPVDVSWLSTSPNSGTISAGQSEDITVTFNATAMDGGSYSATISITSNDTADAVINVPVSLDVTMISMYYVTPMGSDSTGNGTYENPFATIQKGIDAASSGDTVSVAAGTYVENINYNGKNIAVLGENMETTIIDGNETASVVVFNGLEESTAHLSGFTLTNGLPTGAWPASRGGGINCQQASPTLSNLLITGNSSTAGGGGIYLYSGSDAKITDVIIKENIGGWGGGGMYIEGSDAELTNVHIHSNDDGGVKLQNADVSFNYVTISDNESYGMHIEYSEPTFNHVTIVNNDTYGVGLYSTWSHPVFTNSIIANNGTQVTTNQSTGPYGISVSYSNIQGGLDELDSLEFDPDSVNWNSGNIDANPLFCEPDSNNYHLSGNSPSAGTGEYGADMGAFGVGCGTLEIEFPSIVNIWDVPNDQGNWVYIQFNPSAHDASDEGPLGSYTIERLDDEEWVSLHSIDAYGADHYTTEAHTLMDSTEEDDGMTSYRVVAAMEVGALISEPSEGYSIDNIAPGVPTGLMATVSETGIHLNWDLSPAEDFQYFNLEKSSTADFGEYQVIETADTAYLDADYEIDVTVYYRLVAYDDGGNASERSVAIDITVLWADLGIAIPDEFAIHQNYPNPFNPVTTLRYDLPEQGHVRITIYDMLGRDVKTLINEYQDPGYKSIIWNATNDYGKPVSAGMYLYQIQAGEYMEVRKMVLVK